MTYEEKKERAFEIIRGSMEYNHMSDKELKEDGLIMVELVDGKFICR